MRCGWCEGDPLYERYHDEEWGRPVDDDHTMFEFLTLESAQAGLSWITILRRRENYRKAFAGFDPAKVAAFTETDVERLMQEWERWQAHEVGTVREDEDDDDEETDDEDA